LDPIVTNKDPDSEPARPQILLFSHKSVERTDKVKQNKILIQKFSSFKISFIKTFKNMKKFIFCMLIVTEDFGADPDAHPDPLVRGIDPDPY
jgi:hypothetical protein